MTENRQRTDNHRHMGSLFSAQLISLAALPSAQTLKDAGTQSHMQTRSKCHDQKLPLFLVLLWCVSMRV